MIYIDEVNAQEVLDSRGNPTIKATIALSDGNVASAIVPSGASTGKREALELRDNKERFLGKGVLKACENVNTTICDSIAGLSPFDQAVIDNLLIELDGTENFSNLGANATLGVSMAVARAAAKSLNIPLYRYLGGANALTLPIPMLNIINGGSHADNTVDFQEYMIMPVGFECFSEALRASAEIYQCLKKILKDSKHITSIGDEGGFAPNLKTNEEPIQIILEAVKKAGYKEGEQIAIALDVASSEFVNDKGIYCLKGEGRNLSSEELIEYYEKLIAKYPIVSIEDGLSEDDWEGWSKLTQKLGNKVQLVGDDLFVTNKEILKKKHKYANTILIKPNQIGTYTEMLETIKYAKSKNMKTIISHRSGETENTIIADLSVGLNLGQIKCGSMSRVDRTAKYNQLIRIEENER